MTARLSRRLRLVAGALGVVSMIGIASPSLAQQEAFIGEIKFFGGNFAPRSWALCDGQLLPIAQNQALFSILGTIYGGDGRTTFALPDMRGRSPVHEGSGPGLPSVSLGQKAGAASFTLSTSNMPSHNHSASTTTTTTTTTTSTLRGQSGNGTINSPGGNALANDGSDRIYSAGAPDVDMHAGAIVSTSSSASSSTTTIGNQGGSQAVSYRSPYVAVNCIIALQGLFPSRN